MIEKTTSINKQVANNIQIFVLFFAFIWMVKILGKAVKFRVLKPLLFIRYAGIISWDMTPNTGSILYARILFRLALFKNPPVPHFKGGTGKG